MNKNNEMLSSYDVYLNETFFMHFEYSLVKN